MMDASAGLPQGLPGSKIQEWHRDRLAVVYLLSELRREFDQFTGGF